MYENEHDWEYALDVDRFMKAFYDNTTYSHLKKKRLHHLPQNLSTMVGGGEEVEMDIECG